jgi:hypothetical protein
VDAGQSATARTARHQRCQAGLAERRSYAAGLINCGRPRFGGVSCSRECADLSDDGAPETNASDFTDRRADFVLPVGCTAQWNFGRQRKVWVGHEPDASLTSTWLQSPWSLGCGDRPPWTMALGSKPLAPEDLRKQKAPAKPGPHANRTLWALGVKPGAGLGDLREQER